MYKFVQFALTILLVPCFVVAQESVDYDMVNRIRYEGLQNSEVMDTVGYLTDVVGPRLTGSPSLKMANEWAREKFLEWGLESAHLESWDFGRGWSFSRVAVHMLEPRQAPLLALPKAWTPGTEGAVVGTVMRVSVESAEDLEKYKGRVAGKVLLLDSLDPIEERDSLFFQRYSDEELAEMTQYEIRAGRRPDDYRRRMMARRRMQSTFRQFLIDEKVLATVEISSRDNGLVRVSGGGSREVGENPGVTELVMAVEHYNWLVRLLDDHNQEVRLELDVEAAFHDDDLKGYNVFGEIPGGDKADEVVLLGAHLDSWHTGSGATDNASGCGVMMEAIRILQALDVKPRRTIRIGLWGGEEQGFLGSTDYVHRHLASPREADESGQGDAGQGVLEFKPAYEDFSVYFNLDNGGGRIRGIYAQENAAVMPIFEAWMEPFADLAATTVTSRNTSGTDHLPFDRVGLPGFQFIQDELDYMTRTHHSNVDVYDHLRESDLIQAATIIASFAYHAAMREERIPRKPHP